MGKAKEKPSRKGRHYLVSGVERFTSFLAREIEAAREHALVLLPLVHLRISIKSSHLSMTLTNPIAFVTSTRSCVPHLYREAPLAAPQRAAERQQ